MSKSTLTNADMDTIVQTIVSLMRTVDVIDAKGFDTLNTVWNSARKVADENGVSVAEFLNNPEMLMKEILN